MQDVFKSISVTELDQLSHKLKEFSFIDIGVITQVNTDGTVNVASFQYKSGVRIEYKNIELISANGAYVNTSSIMMGLIIRPLTSLNLREFTLNNPNPYDPAGAKFLPITTNLSSILTCGFDATGNFVISSPDYSFACGDKGISIVHPYIEASLDDDSIIITNKSYTLEMLEDFTIRKQYINIDNLIYKMEEYLPDGTITVFSGAKEVLTTEEFNDITSYKKWTWIKTFNLDGSELYTQYEDQENDKKYLEVSVSATGDLVITNGKNSSDEFGGVIVSIDGTNKQVSIQTGEDITTFKDGGTEQTIKGDWTVNVDGNVTVKAASGKTLEIGNSSVTVGSAFSDLIDALTGLMTVGSPASHTLDPGTITKLTTLKTTITGAFK